MGRNVSFLILTIYFIKHFSLIKCSSYSTELLLRSFKQFFFKIKRYYIFHPTKYQMDINSKLSGSNFTDLTNIMKIM